MGRIGDQYEVVCAGGGQMAVNWEEQVTGREGRMTEWNIWEGMEG